MGDRASLTVVICYHLFCMGIIATALHGDWMDLASGLDWEFWALWQLGLVLHCVVQTLGWLPVPFFDCFTTLPFYRFAVTPL